MPRLVPATALLLVMATSLPAAAPIENNDSWSVSQTIICGSQLELEMQRAGRTLAQIEAALGTHSCAYQSTLPPAYLDHGGTLIVATHASSDSHGTRSFSGQHHRSCYYVRTETGYTISPCDWRQQLDVSKAIRLLRPLPLPRLNPTKPR